MRIALIHYHQRPSGVNQVLLLQKEALKNLGHDVFIPEIPELDYCEENQLSGTAFLNLIERSTSGKIDLWIIHNPTLGKNATFPDFIEALAHQGTPVILQCHDFAEDGRPANYQRLANTDRLYPLAPQIHYALINSRDAAILKNAGIPTPQIHFLPNAVIRPPLPAASSEPPFIFYPVRGIRRKNLGEFCLWAKLAPAGVRFAIAAKPDNHEWLSTYEEWKSFAAQENLPLEFDVVTTKHPFEYWLEKSSHLATTSIAEGFGLTFIEPHFLNRPLIGRDLPEITRDFTAAGLTPGKLYQEIPVPIHHLDIDQLKGDFHHQITSTFQSYGQLIDPQVAWKNLIENGTVDFGNLPEAHQRSLIKKQSFPELKGWLAQALAETPSLGQNIKPWSTNHYQNRLKDILNSVLSSPSCPPEFLPKQNILQQFLDPSRFHFLRT